MGLATAQDFFGRPGKADGIEVKLQPRSDTTAVTNALRGNLGNTFRVTNWMEYDEAASAGFAMLKRVYAMVLLLLIGVAAFNLIATLIMVVMEKRKDIAVLLAMGATPGEVRCDFPVQGNNRRRGRDRAGAGYRRCATCFALARYQFIHIPSKIYGISTVPIDAEPAKLRAGGGGLDGALLPGDDLSRPGRPRARHRSKSSAHKRTASADSPVRNLS
jgi:lipoprotein-releasing system permease protein